MHADKLEPLPPEEAPQTSAESGDPA